MPAFHYRAISRQGREQRGVLEADSPKQARQQLREQGLLPLKVQAVHGKITRIAPLLSFIKRPRGVTAKALALMTRQLATLVSAGLPLEESLLAIAEQNEEAHLKGLILSVRGKVVEGHPLAVALEEHPEAFSMLYCKTVAAGEKTGHLDQILNRLADYTEAQWQLRQQLKTALIYPAMMVLVAVGIVGFLLANVVPKMVDVYAHMNQTLPFLTVLLLAISHGVQSMGLVILVGFGLGLGAWRYALKRHQALRAQTHAVLLKTPWLGAALKTINTARFARTFSMLTASGVPVLEAMTVSARLMTVIPVREAVMQAVLQVREGVTIHQALKQTHFFSPMFVHMVASGEASGQLENMLARVADQQETEIKRLIEVSLALFEPAIILLMGGIVLFIVLAVLLPIFQLNQIAG